ncbi:uncharacterized protein LOC26527074 [Drosophila erecta]|uniref:Uncharacterized protein n=1 Tax=Drosophila erecta TaxID=7220 RepID=A0A0Q5WL92_DROER|nr:uncharacterized protein LOC26527074 [Drosophila erecta]KQS70921.1 uncharacterized protein Dere_GG27250 [Drosophila erecta]
MCIHCCRLRRTPCPPIPYSCPHCPVRTISSCCPLGSRPFTENPFIRGQDREPTPDPCDSLPPRWLEVNRRVIYALANRLYRSPEAAHYILLRLLYANYRKVMMISRKRRRYRVPLSGFPDQDLFSASALFDSNGYLSDPMVPETLGKLLHMMQDYILRLRALNRKYKWYGNGEDLGDVLLLLGEQDELVRLLRNLFGDSDLVSIPKLLGALSELEINNLFGKWKKKTVPCMVRSISDLYSEVTEPKSPILISLAHIFNKEVSPSSVGPSHLKNISNFSRKSLPVIGKNSPSFGSKSEKCISTSKTNLIPSSIKCPQKTNIKQPAISTRILNPPSKNAQEDSMDGKAISTKPKQSIHSPFDSQKNSTWMPRHTDSHRLMTNGRIAERRVHYCKNQDEQLSLYNLLRR